MKVYILFIFLILYPIILNCLNNNYITYKINNNDVTQMISPPYKKTQNIIQQDCTINDTPCQKNDDCEVQCSHSGAHCNEENICDYNLVNKCLNGGISIRYVWHDELKTVCACREDGYYIGEQCQYKNSFRSASQKTFSLVNPIT
ncbi:hypothetical protein TCON_2284 [Astathelohania contejeani]|uniref:EGF-like domain-containing protein n=1 Tax=Astathelohania contejeani TaxID=164912 RepID=A0ABQ7HWK8_9MICR|nr:hypothetical protein TCON_2284 [Thelohania contejeani]